MPRRLYCRCRAIASLLLLFLIALAPTVARPGELATGNALFRELTTAGVAVGATGRLVLPAPTFSDNMDAPGQDRALAELADESHPVSALLRKSVVAPFKLKISDLGDKPATGRRVDLWFVVYADLDRIADADVLRRAFDAEAKADSSATALVALSETDLQKRNITPTEHERWFSGSANLFDRVQLQATLVGEQSRTPDSILVAMRIDPRFDDDRQFPNRWLPLARDEAGKKTLGEPHPYHAAGGYIKATRLQKPAGAILVEYHVIFDEPAGWFGGANLLRSKLPILCQDTVRKFRRSFGAP